MAPRDLRSAACGGFRATTPSEHLALRLGYRPPYDFASMLAFLGGARCRGRISSTPTCYAGRSPGDGAHATPG